MYVVDDGSRDYEDPHVKLSFQTSNFISDTVSIYLNNKLMSKNWKLTFKCSEIQMEKTISY